MSLTVQSRSDRVRFDSLATLRAAAALLAWLSVLPLVAVATNSNATELASGGALDPRIGGQETPSDLPAAIVASVAQLEWLAGRWRGTFGDSPYVEDRTSAAGGMMLWMAKTFRNESLVFFEFGAFVDVDGGVLMTPYPRGQQAASFTLVELETSPPRAVFDNPDNDFPTRFVYELTGDNSMRITLLGAEGEAGWTQRLDLERLP